MAQVIFYIIVGFLVFEFILERILDYFNSTYWSEKLPAELAGIYDPERYRKSQQYLKVKQRFSLFVESFSLILMLFMLVFGGFAYIDSVVRQITMNPVWMALLFFGVIGLASDILSIPFSYYSTFVIEERFGFNKTTVKTFILDRLKGWLLGGLIIGGLLALIVWVYEMSGPWFWLIAWGLITVFMIFMAMFFSNVIVPWFNKQKPLEAGELRDAIESYAGSVGFRLKNIFVIDGSRRSSKGNAYFTGLGPKKRIVLYDTLIEKHTVEELVAVLAHETGHYKKKHTLKGMIMSILQTGLMLFIFSLFLQSPALSHALGSEIPSFHLSLLAFGLLYSPLSLLTGIVSNIVSRKHEYQADHFAAVTYKPEALALALKKMSVDNLSNLRPHPAYVFFHYSHPPLLNRLSTLQHP